MNPEFPVFSGRPTRILVVRPDRLGDVILSTPVLQRIKMHSPEALVTFLVRDSVLPLFKDLPILEDCFVFDPEGRHRGGWGFIRLIRDLNQRKFDIAVVLQSHPKVAAALFFAGIPKRIGPLSKIHSYLFYNRGMRQRRSQVDCHEADYNLQLLEQLGMMTPLRSVPTQVFVSQEVCLTAKNWLTGQGWDPRNPLIVIHPGMGGSALNWPEDAYIKLIQRLVSEHQTVLVTGGPTESALIFRIQAALESQRSRAWGPYYYIGLHSELVPFSGSVEFLGGLFAWASVVVAPSTGPLHLAVALKKPVVTFYPPIRVQSPKRWGPYVLDEAMASVWVPPVSFEENSDCMQLIRVEDAYQAVKKYLRK